MAIKKVNTATLIRGEVYTLRHPDNKPQNPRDSLQFTRGVPVVIEEAHVLAILTKLKEPVTDGDGDMVEKAVFRIDRNVDAPAGENDSGIRVTTTRKAVVKRRSAAG